jgi:ribosome-associated translation inhibitor RaiA
MALICVKLTGPGLCYCANSSEPGTLLSHRPGPDTANDFLLFGSSARAAARERISVMHIQINTDENIEGSEALSARVSDDIHKRLDRYSQHITRIEVHLSDGNAEKSGSSDKRCLIEARLEGRQPEAVSDQSDTLERAYSGAAKKMQHALETTLGKLNHVKGTETIRTSER